MTEVAEDIVTFLPVADASLSLTTPTRLLTLPFDQLYSASSIDTFLYWFIPSFVPQPQPVVLLRAAYST